MWDLPTKDSIFGTATSQIQHSDLVAWYWFQPIVMQQTGDGNGPSWHKVLCKHVSSSVNVETLFKFQDTDVQKCTFKKEDKFSHINAVQH